MNVFNEKIFTLIWFWLAFLTIMNFKSVLLTIIRNSFHQFNYAFIVNYLDLHSKKERFKRHALIKHFIYDYLSIDGVLILRLTSENISDLLTSEVINELWNEYKKLSNLPLSDRETYQGMKTNQTSTDTITSNKNIHYRQLFN